MANRLKQATWPTTQHHRGRLTVQLVAQSGLDYPISIIPLPPPLVTFFKLLNVTSNLFLYLPFHSIFIKQNFTTLS